MYGHVAVKNHQRARAVGPEAGSRAALTSKRCTLVAGRHARMHWLQTARNAQRADSVSGGTPVGEFVNRACDARNT